MKTALLSLFCAAIVASGSVARADLLAYWDFNEGPGSGTATESVNGNVGTLTNFNTATEWVSGFSGNVGDFALDYDGTNNWVNVPDSASVSPTSNFTLTSWINADTFASVARNILAKDSNSSYRWRVQSDGQLWLLINDGAGFQLFSSGAGNPKPTTGTWHQTSVSANFTTDEVRFYLDGALVETLANTEASVADTAGPLRFGTFSGSAEFFDGRIDEIGIFNEDLGDGHHAAIYKFAAEPQLEYDLGEVAQLFDVFDGDLPSATIDGRTWTFLANAPGQEGDLIQLPTGDFVFNFDGVSGVTTFVPEPSSFALLVLGLCGLARRRRQTPLC